MKRIVTLMFLATLSMVTLYAQTEYDALRLSQTDILGSARYLSMGGAFGALGGEASALKDNPAGLGVFRKGEIVTTLNLSHQRANSQWYGNNENIRKLSLKFNNFSYVMAIPLWHKKKKGLLQHNFHIGFNRLKNFNREIKVAGKTPASFTDFLGGFTTGLQEADLKYESGTYDPYNNQNIPWLSILAYDSYLINYDNTNPTNWSSTYNGQANTEYILYETGGINEISMGWGGNFNNRLFVGANLNFWSIQYRLDSFLRENFSTGNFQLNNLLRQTGGAFNLKLGAIYLPTENFRLGLSIHTPTIMGISENTNASISFKNSAFKDKNGKDIEGKAYIPEDGGYQEFELISGFQTQISAACLLGKYGLISAEYNFINYPNSLFSDIDGRTAPFEPENKGMKKVLKNGHLVKLGAEARINKNISLRAGYAYQSSPTNPDYVDGKSLRLNTVNTNTEYIEQGSANYFSGGIGYRKANWYVDMGYMIKLQNEDLYPYQYDRNILNGANFDESTGNFSITLGLKI